MTSLHNPGIDQLLNHLLHWVHYMLPCSLAISFPGNLSKPALGSLYAPMQHCNFPGKLSNPALGFLDLLLYRLAISPLVGDGRSCYKLQVAHDQIGRETGVPK
jgi:hypothetical protein